MGLSDNESATRNGTTVERTDRELVVTRTFDAPAHIVFEAWTRPDLFKRWWAPKSMGIPLRSCDLDVRVGGTYRIVFGKNDTETFAFFGTYLEVEPNARLVWTNEESEDGPVTTVTFEEVNGKTLLVFNELYASKEALDEMFIGMEGGMPEQFEQLVELLASLEAGADE
ncbi:MAG: ATPase [Sphingomonas bacterium]|uniref:SRPBCC family protein n=1 Tax=Sphingomonas bacterium TaxID=1895847 RepID=UPI0026367368|nr:SRPBCC family protein [Sphingomonas bacterium]MDB5708132.1 ATPase [Sphingomonas bacterium]